MLLLKRLSKKQSVQAPVYRTIALSFFGISAVIAVIVFFISFSWAAIRITPEIINFSITSRIAIQEGASPQQGVLSGKVIQKELEGAGTFAATTAESRPSRMSGIITVVNKTNRAQPLRTTTRFLTPNNILFRSAHPVTVPAGGNVDVAVQADKEGDLGSLDTSRFTIPGLREQLQDEIYGAHFSMSTGSTQEIKKVTSEDIQRAEGELIKKLSEKFSLMIDAEKPSLGAPAAGVMFRSDVIGRTLSRAVGDEAPEFSARIKVRFTAVLFNEQELLDHLAGIMRSKITSGYELMSPRKDGYSGSVEAYDPSTRTATLSVMVQGGKIRTDDIRPYHTRDLIGLKKESIIEYFKGYDDIKDVSVSFYPFWVSRAPLLVDHIKILVDKSAQ